MFLAKAFQTDPRPRQEAKSLVEANYSVFVLAWDREHSFRPVEEVDGVTVHSFSHARLGGSSAFGLALGALIFQVLLLLESVRLVRRLKHRPIIHAHDFNTLLPGCLLRVSRLCVGLVYDSHELSYAVYSEFFGSTMGCAIREIEKRCLRYVDAVITVSAPFADYLRGFNSATEIVYNCPRASDIPRVPRRETRHELGLPLDAFIVSYVGTIRHDFALDLLLDVASSVRDPSVQFLVVGDGPLARRLLEVARVRQARLRVLPRVSRERALRYVSASDLTWAVYQDESLNMRLTMPWKFFESLACGVPLIVEKGTVRAQLVQRLRCGLVLEGRDPRQISELIVSLASDRERYLEMCVASRNAVLGMTWEAMSCKLTEIHERLSGLHNAR